MLYMYVIYGNKTYKSLPYNYYTVRTLSEEQWDAKKV